MHAYVVIATIFGE